MNKKSKMILSFSSLILLATACSNEDLETESKNKLIKEINKIPEKTVSFGQLKEQASSIHSQLHFTLFELENSLDDEDDVEAISEVKQMNELLTKIYEEKSSVVSEMDSLIAFMDEHKVNIEDEYFLGLFNPLYDAYESQTSTLENYVSLSLSVIEGEDRIFEEILSILETEGEPEYDDILPVLDDLKEKNILLEEKIELFGEKNEVFVEKMNDFEEGI